MTVLDNSTPPSLYKEPSTPTSSASYPSYRRLSTSTTSPPPPYHSTGTDTHALLRDEKLHRSEKDHTSIIPHQEHKAGMKKKAYTEYPSAFSRVLTLNTQALKPFDPLSIAVGGSGRSLDKGLSLDLPPSTEEVHPFTQRDITEADWTKFMQGLRDGTAVSNRTKHQTFLVPLALGLGPGAFFISRAIKSKIRRRKLAYAIDLISTWNQDFFNPRRVEVVLMRGFRPLTNIKLAAQPEESGKSHHDDLSWVSMSSHYDSSSTTSSDEGSFGCCNQPRLPMRLVVVSI